MKSFSTNSRSRPPHIPNLADDRPGKGNQIKSIKINHLGPVGVGGVLVESADAESHGGAELVERHELPHSHRARAAPLQHQRAANPASAGGGGGGGCRPRGGAAPEVRRVDRAAGERGGEGGVAVAGGRGCGGVGRWRGRQQPRRRRHGDGGRGGRRRRVVVVVGWFGFNGWGDASPPQLPLLLPAKILNELYTVVGEN